MTLPPGGVAEDKPGPAPAPKPPAPVLVADGLVRSFGPIRAVEDVSFELDEGTLLTVFGPNGAGKTTLLRLLGGVLKPNRGAVAIAGEWVSPRSDGWRHRLGALSHQSFLYGPLTCAENLRFFGALYGLRDLGERVERRLEQVQLLQRAHDPVRTLSRGMRQRLALARALLHDPDVVLLDEPYTGLDAHAADVLGNVLSALKDGRRTVVMVTHNLTQGLAWADRVMVLVRGRSVFEARRDALDAGSFEGDYRSLVERSM